MHLICQLAEVRAFRDVLAYQPVRVLVCATLPGVVWASIAVLASWVASFPASLRISTRCVHLSFVVMMAPLRFLPIIVSISKSPKRFFSSTIDGLSDMSTLSWMISLGLYRLSRLRFRRPPCLRLRANSSLPRRFSCQIHR